MKKLLCFTLSLWFVWTVGLAGCASRHPGDLPVESPLPESVLPMTIQPIANSDFSADTARPYLTQVTFTPTAANYFDLVNQKLPLNQAEMALLSRQGFALSERWTWQRFVEAYAWIYWQDLPVLVTTDSLLHTVHQSYDDLLKDLEQAILIPQLHTILTATATQVQAEQQANANPALAPLYADVATYFQTASALLDGTTSRDAAVQSFVDLATQANRYTETELFGSKRTIDFSLFKPRGHYAGHEPLEKYFRAMSWLAQLDFRFVEYNQLTSEPIINPSQIAAAVMLRNALDAAGQRQSWATFNALFEVLVGRSDNMTLSDLDRFLADMAFTDPAAILAANPEALLTQLTQHDYGQQRVTGQIFYRHIANTTPEAMPRPVSFLLMGQRFAIDAYVAGNVVFDRVMVDGQPVMRPLPSPLDVMYALGNDRAATHLTAELAAYPYGGYLAALRQQVDELPADFWTTPLYNQWLGLIHTLNAPTLGTEYPQSMRTSAWADKMLQTQLASWTQLRHDNLLYVKQSFTTAGVLCEYPAGYVEPYPAFYQRLQQLATTSHTALSAFNIATQGDYATYVKQRALDYFTALNSVATQLQTLAEKELRLEEFTPEETLFLRSIVVLKEDLQIAGCGGPTFEDQWNGWYMSLFYARDDNPALIADVHTNPTNDPAHPLYPPRVLHAATGPLAPLFFVVDTDEGSALYVGPAFTYYEVVTTGDTAQAAPRLTDEEWRTQLQQGTYPSAPGWTASFRVASGQRETLTLPQSFPADWQPSSIFSPLPTPAQ